MRAGGGTNHRFGLYDAILVKDNHVGAGRRGRGGRARARCAAAPDAPGRGRVRDAAPRSTRRSPPAPTRLLLDNMTPDELREAVAARRRARATLEASRRHRPRHGRGDRRDRRRLHLGRRAHPFGAPPSTSHCTPGAAAVNLPMAPCLTPRRTPQTEDIAALQRRGPRARRASATPSSSPTTTRCPRSRTSPTTSATRSASRAQARRDRRRRDRLLRRALHGRDGVDPLARTRRCCIPDLDAGCSLADSITADAAARLEGRAPRRDRRHVRQHDRRGQGGDRLLLHVGERRRPSSSTSTASTARTPRSSSAPTCSSAPTSRRRPAARMHVWIGECHVHAGIRPADIERDARRAPRRRLPHPPRVRLLDLGHGVRRRRRRRRRGRPHALDRRDARLRASSATARRDGDRRDRDRDAPPAAQAAPGRRLHRRQRGGDLPLHEDDHAAEAARHPARRRASRSRCPTAIAERARVPIERMVAIG